MTVTADSKRRVVLPSAKPGDLFDVRVVGPGVLQLVKMEAVQPQRARVTFRKRGGFTVAFVDRRIDEDAIKDALAEFP